MNGAIIQFEDDYFFKNNILFKEIDEIFNILSDDLIDYVLYDTNAEY